jgi:tRNA(Ile)-lysidine synthase
MSDILHSLRQFLHNYYQTGRPVLLGYSGGPDSSALLHCLYKLRWIPQGQLIVVHIDHSWREESKEEAVAIKGYVESLGFPCIIECLEKESDQKNLEEKARLARIGLFQKQYRAFNAQALILAHQAGDQAETVMKRLFEGSHLMALGAMQQVSCIEEMTIWRPFLEVSKKKLLNYCRENGVSYFLDRMNADLRFLRARMRERLLPDLEENFGKGIEANLVRLAQTCHELQDYLSAKISPFLEKLEVKDGQLIIDLNGAHPIEAKAIIRKLAQLLRISLGQQHLNHLVELVKKEGRPRQFSIGEAVFYGCRNQLRVGFKNGKIDANFHCDLNKNKNIGKNKKEVLLTN